MTDTRSQTQDIVPPPGYPSAANPPSQTTQEVKQKKKRWFRVSKRGEKGCIEGCLAGLCCCFICEECCF